MKYLNLVNAVIEVLASYKNENKKFSIHDITSSIRSTVNSGECIIVDLVSLYGTKTVMHESVKTAFEYILPILSVNCELVDGKYRSFEFIDNVAVKNAANTANTVDNSKSPFAQTAKELSDVLANEIVKHLDSIGVGVDLSDVSNVSDCGCSRKSQNKSGCQNSEKSNPIHDALNSLNSLDSSTTISDNSSPSEDKGKVVFNQPKAAMNPLSKPRRDICSAFSTAVHQYYRNDFSKYTLTYDKLFNRNAESLDGTIEKIKAYFKRNYYFLASLRNIAKSVGLPCSLVAYCIWKSKDDFEFRCDYVEPSNHSKDGGIKNADAISVYFIGE